MTIETKHFFKYKFPAIAWATLIFILSSIPGAKLPRWTFLHFDKVIHAGFYFILGLFVYRFLEPKEHSNSFNWKRAFVSVAIVVVYGIFDEFHQSFVLGRMADVIDATADTIGGLLSAMMMFVYTKIKMRRMNSQSIAY